MTSLTKRADFFAADTEVAGEDTVQPFKVVDCTIQEQLSNHWEDQPDSGCVIKDPWVGRKKWVDLATKSRTQNLNPGNPGKPQSELGWIHGKKSSDKPRESGEI